MTPEEIKGHLAQKLGIEIEWPEESGPGDPAAILPVERWKDACLLARDEQELQLDYLRSLCGVDRPDDGKIEVVVHLFSYEHKHAIVLKTKVDRDDPKVASVAEVWPAANWHERETYDLLGVVFDGHPDLTRLLMPDDWEGHPLRKDYQEKDSYQGIPTSRAGYSKG